MLQEIKHFYENYCESIREEADTLRAVEMPEITEELFAVYENTGNRLAYEGVYFKRRKFLAVFGLKAVLDREERDILKLEEIMLDICNEECWALPAHVNRKMDENWRICIDLFAAETAQSLSEISALLKDALSARTIETVRREVMRRVLVPFSTSRVPYAHWERDASNWCAVCGGSIGSAAIYMLQDRQKELDAILDRICYALETYYLKSFAEDGTCLEGLGYFTYGMTYFAGFAGQLYEFTVGKRDLFRNEKLARIAAFQAKCYFQSGMTVSFADGVTNDTFRPGLTFCLAMKYPEAEIPAMERAAKLDDDDCYRWMGLYRNLTWTKEYMEFLGETEADGKAEVIFGRETVSNAEMAFRREAASEKGTASRRKTTEKTAAISGRETTRETEAASCQKRNLGQIVLPDAQWTICQSRNGAGMAAKGGCNGEPHNHNDVGSFFYLKGKDFLLTDLGCGEYTKDYFSGKRYEYLCCRSLGHNVPLIDGKEQLAGAEYGCDCFEADGLGRTSISFAGAYANPELESLVRTFNWNEEDGTLKVEDRYQVTARLQSIRENLVTGWKPEVQGNMIRIQGKRGGCVIEIADPNVKVECIRKDFSDHGGRHRDVWLLQWEVPVTGTVGHLQACFVVKTFERST